MRQTIGMNVGGTVPTKIIVNGTTLDKCKVNGTDLIKTYQSISLSIAFLVQCSAFSEDVVVSCNGTFPADTTMHILSITPTWSASGDKTVSSISIAPVVELKENDCAAITATYGTRVVVTSGQTITPTTSETSDDAYNQYIDFRCQLKSQTLIINFTDGTSKNYSISSLDVQSDRKKINAQGYAYTSFNFSYSLNIEWEV